MKWGHSGAAIERERLGTFTHFRDTETAALSGESSAMTAGSEGNK